MNRLTLDYFFTYASDEEVRAVASMIIYRFEDKFKNLFKISEFGHSLTDKELDEFAKELRKPQ